MDFMTDFDRRLRRARTIFVLAFLALMALAVSRAEAAAMHIDCPVEQARREITSDLPSEWWTTPIINSLTETEIAEVGGKTTLICRYGPAGNLMKLAPAGATCTAVAGGFNCASGGVIAPSTYSTGPITLKQTFLADFDDNASGMAAADIWFEAETASLLYLTPRNGAKFSVGDRSNRGLDGCSSASYSGGRVSLSDVPVGSYICVKTNEGRISQFRVNAISAGSPKIVKLGYTTWE